MGWSICAESRACVDQRWVGDSRRRLRCNARRTQRAAAGLSRWPSLCGGQPSSQSSRGGSGCGGGGGIATARAGDIGILLICASSPKLHGPHSNNLLEAPLSTSTAIPATRVSTAPAMPVWPDVTAQPMLPSSNAPAPVRYRALHGKQAPPTCSRPFSRLLYSTRLPLHFQSIPNQYPARRALEIPIIPPNLYRLHLLLNRPARRVLTAAISARVDALALDVRVLHLEPRARAAVGLIARY